ncbi:MAG: hypothetical protein ACOCRX_00845 [Candidatus Woesearchaeota archaeon]
MFILLSRRNSFLGNCLVKGGGINDFPYSFLFCSGDYVLYIFCLQQEGHLCRETRNKNTKNFLYKGEKQGKTFQG